MMGNWHSDKVRPLACKTCPFPEAKENETNQPEEACKILSESDDEPECDDLLCSLDSTRILTDEPECDDSLYPTRILACSSIAPREMGNSIPVLEEAWTNPRLSEEPFLPFESPLIPAAKILWDLTIYQSKNLNTLQACDNALKKYRLFFAALIYNFNLSPNELLYPPDNDIYIVWIAHVLRTEKYKNDCQTQSGWMIPCHLQPLDEESKQKLIENTNQIMSTLALEQEALPKVSITAEELLKDINWYDNLLHENPAVVPGKALPENFLKEALKDYERYLWLLYKYRKRNDVPLNASYKADILWHTHILNTNQYIADCEKLVGVVLAHEPWPDRSLEEDIKIRHTNTNIWAIEFEITNYLVVE